MIQIDLTRVDGDFHMGAVNEQGNEVHLDASPDIGGTGKGMRPMQMLLASLAGCSTIDIVNILKKQKQVITGIKVKVRGERDEKSVPAVYTKIELHFILFGNLDLDKVERAVALSVEKYCYVGAMLVNVKISHSCEIQN